MAKRVNKRNEIGDLEASYRKIVKKSSRANTPGSRLATFAFLAAGLAVLLLIGSGLFYWYSITVSQQIDARVSIGGISLGELNSQEAEDLLIKKQSSLLPTNPISLHIVDKDLVLTPDEIGLYLDTKAIVRDALVYSQEARNNPDAPALSMNPLDYAKPDGDMVRHKLIAFLQDFDGIPTETTYSVQGTRPDLTKPPVVGAEQQVLTINLGLPKLKVEAEAIYKAVMLSYQARTFALTFDATSVAPTAITAEALFEEFCVAPTNATIDPLTYQITEGIYGYGFSVDKLSALLASAQWGETVSVSFAPITPKITGSMLNKEMFKTEISASVTQGMSNTNRNNNLVLACKAINGLMLFPGDEFSFWQALGQLTEAKGYLDANAYDGIQNPDTIGGGVCQVSSTLYHCAILADMEILERKNHDSGVSYTSYGYDAAVIWGETDLRFRNSTAHPIRIEAIADQGKVTIRIFSKATQSYDIQLQQEVLETTPFETVYQEYPKDNAFGYQDGHIITIGQTGYRYQTYRCKYNRTTGALISKTEETQSLYKKVDQVEVSILQEPSVPDTSEETIAPLT